MRRTALKKIQQTTGRLPCKWCEGAEGRRYMKPQERRGEYGAAPSGCLRPVSTAGSNDYLGIVGVADGTGDMEGDDLTGALLEVVSLGALTRQALKVDGGDVLAGRMTYVSLTRTRRTRGHVEQRRATGGLLELHDGVAVGTSDRQGQAELRPSLD